MALSTAQLEQITWSDYSRARFKASLRSIMARLLGWRNDLLSLEKVLPRLPFRGQHSTGLQTVAIDQIIGSAGRNADFDRAFFPRRVQTQARWRSVDWATHKGIALPPVELHQIGNVYFVIDGHHRISVAREHGQDFIEAYVTEIDVAVCSEEELIELVGKAGA
jgi:hypothetical protein